MSNGPQILKRKARACQSTNGCSLLALTAPEFTLCNLPARRAPKDRFLPWLDANDDENDRSKRFAHSLLSRPDLVAGGHKTAAVWLHRRSGRHGDSSDGCFRKAPFLPYFPSFPSVTRSVLIPRPSARRVSASPMRAPKGFRLSKNLCAQDKNAKDFSNLPKKRHLALGSGAHSRRFAQECPEGNPGKYKQGETQWHSTKTKSL
jgi:hypothetical protein